MHAPRLAKTPGQPHETGCASFAQGLAPPASCFQNPYLLILLGCVLDTYYQDVCLTHAIRVASRQPVTMWEHQEGTSIEPFNTNISVQGWVNSLGASCIGFLKAICMKQRSTLCGTKQAERAVGVARAACFEPLARRIRQRWCLPLYYDQ